MTSANRTDDKLAELNQPSLWSGINAYRSDPLIVDLTAALPRGIREDLENMGRYVTLPEAQELARMANQGTPQLRTHGPRGERLDVVEFHPAWHALMRRSMSVACIPRSGTRRPIPKPRMRPTRYAPRVST